MCRLGTSLCVFCSCFEEFDNFMKGVLSQRRVMSSRQTDRDPTVGKIHGDYCLCGNT